MLAVSVKNLSFTYPQQQEQAAHPILHNVSFDVPTGAFTLLCGRTGSGKTTLLRHLVPALTPHGKRSGQLVIAGAEIDHTSNDIPPRHPGPRPGISAPDALPEKGKTCTSVGFVQQDPDNQIVTDIVFHELAFALENQGLPTATIRRRVAEVASYFGLEYLLESSTHTLSGGQKQILNLAATIVSDPRILVLDEPTAELDPIATQNFLRHLSRVNKELGTTVICCEHRLDEVLTLCDQVLLLNDAHIGRREAAEQVQTFTSQEFVTSCASTHKDLISFLPEPAQVAIACTKSDDELWPLDVKSGRAWLSSFLQSKPYSFNVQIHPITPKDKNAVILRDLSFKYAKHDPFVLKHLSASFERGRIHGIVGGNASGKSTLLSVICDLLRPQFGKVRIDKQLRLAALPQNPKASFVQDTVQEDLLGADSSITLDGVQLMAQHLNIDQLLDRHPFDLSGGEAQKAALAKLLLLDPDVILLDEPTKGLDAQAKQEIGQIFTDLASQGKTLIVVTHDLSFAANYTQTCSLLANGEIIARDETRAFFTGNNFYTTATNRMSRNIVDNCVTVDDLVAALAEDKADESASFTVDSAGQATILTDPASEKAK